MEVSAPKDDFSQSLSLDSSTLLFSHIPAIFFVLHLIYEELKLNSLMGEGLRSLVVLLVQLARYSHWEIISLDGIAQTGANWKKKEYLKPFLFVPRLPNSSREAAAAQRWHPGGWNVFFSPVCNSPLCHSRDLKLEAYMDYYYRDYPALVKTSRQTCIIDQGEFKPLPVPWYLDIRFGFNIPLILEDYPLLIPLR